MSLVFSALFCVMAVSLSDYGLYLLGIKPIAIMMALCSYLLLVKHSWEYKIRLEIMFYGLSILCLFIINIGYGSYFNKSLFVPVMSYIFFEVYRAFGSTIKEYDLVIRKFFGMMLVFILGMVLLELATKIGVIDVGIIKRLIIEIGGRIDVFRVKSPFGSPLILSAQLFVFLIYFVLDVNLLAIGLILALLILTGSRTGLIVAMLLTFYKWFIGSSLYEKISFRRIYYLAISIGSAVIVILIAYHFTEGKIHDVIHRIFNIGSVLLYKDESFVGRRYTTISTFQSLLDNLPESLFIGLSDPYVVDAAIISFMAGSGILSGIIFLLYVYYRVYKTTIDYRMKFVVSLLLTLEMLIIGGVFSPCPSFCFFIMTFFLENESYDIKRYVSL